MEDFGYSAQVSDSLLTVSKMGNQIMISITHEVYGRISYLWDDVQLRPGMAPLTAQNRRGIKFKIKMMTNGELRLSAKIPTEGWFTITIAPDWTVGVDRVPVQNPHHHRDEDEYCRVIKGWFIGLEVQTDLQWKAELVDRENMFTMFAADVDHNIIPGPGAVFATWKDASAAPEHAPEDRGNPQRNDSNWWPTDASLSAVIERKLNDLSSLAQMCGVDTTELK